MVIFTIYAMIGGCDKKLTLDSYTDRKGVPFCKACYCRLYGPKGFINGTATFNSYDDSRRENDNTSNDKSATSGVFESNSAPRPDDGRIVNDRNAKTMDTEIIPKAEDIHGLKNVFSGSKGKSCAKCAKSVTLVEERLACNQTWHTDVRDDDCIIFIAFVNIPFNLY